MRGGIQQRDKEGKVFRIQVYTGKDATGKRTRFTETFKGSKADANKRMRALLTSLDKDGLIPTGRKTVAQLLHEWLDGYVATNCSEGTMVIYRGAIDKHLIPALGSIALKDLTPARIQAYYGKAVQNLSNKTVLGHHKVLSASLKFGLRQGYLSSNPAQLVDPPKPHKKQMRTMTPDEVEKLLLISRDNYYYPVIYTAVSSGLRLGEVLALRWRDVDLDMASVSVTQILTRQKGKLVFKEPKTAHSRHRIAMTPKLAVFLREYKASREWLCIQSGRTLTLDDLLFTTYQSNPFGPTTVSHAFHQLTLKAGINGVRFHNLRHTFASLMFLRGAPPKVISECLGHASVAFTMDTYAHIIEGMQEDAMVLLDGVLPSGVTQSFNTKLTPRS